MINRPLSGRSELEMASGIVVKVRLYFTMVSTDSFGGANHAEPCSSAFSRRHFCRPIRHSDSIDDPVSGTRIAIQVLATDKVAGEGVRPVSS